MLAVQLIHRAAAAGGTDGASPMVADPNARAPELVSGPAAVRDGQGDFAAATDSKDSRFAGDDAKSVATAVALGPVGGGASSAQIAAGAPSAGAAGGTPHGL